MRGKLGKSPKLGTGGRITPADAGKTEFIIPLSEFSEDHPRGCGENCKVLERNALDIGSPPRMRGKRFFHVERRRKNRITPADAGKTFTFAVNNVFAEDHPRGCGENLYRCSFFYSIPGSPPRMRGKLAHYTALLCQVGITPADAGKTQSRKIRNRIMQDHPRGCGENPM